MDGTIHELGMGNGIASDPDHADQLTRSSESLSKQVDLDPYLTEHSDGVALLVLAHQTHFHNLLTRAAYETRNALRDEAAVRQVLHDLGPEHTEMTQIRIKSACDPVVESLLFSQEAPLGGPVAGSTDFARVFAAGGPRDSLGRSLRDFDLKDRLFKYPCSYLIYSEQFDSLPDQARQYIYRRLWKILTGRNDSDAFCHLSDNDREAIYQILAETKKGLPGYWKWPR